MGSSPELHYYLLSDGSEFVTLARSTGNTPEGPEWKREYAGGSLDEALNAAAKAHHRVGIVPSRALLDPGEVREAIMHALNQ